MSISDFIERNLTRITTIGSLASGLVFALTLIEGMTQVTRFAALVFAACATAEIIESSDTPRPRGTAMVSMAAFVLIMEGGATAISEGIDKASYIEMAIGLYLMATLWTLLRR